MLEKLKLTVKYPAKLLIWSCWLGIQGLILLLNIIVDVILLGLDCVEIMTSSWYRGRRLREIGFEIIRAMSQCEDIFFDILYAVRYPVRELCRYCWSTRLLKLFLMVGFSPNKGCPLCYVAERCERILSDDEDNKRAKRVFVSKMKLLVEYGATIDNGTEFETLFGLIIDHGWNDELDFLIEKGANVNTRLHFYEDESFSLLQYAANWRKFDTALLLIDKGADFEYSDIPQIFGNRQIPLRYTEAKILCAIYDKDSSAVGELLQSYKDKRRDGVHHDKIEPIFRNVLSQHILPKVQDEQIKNQLNDFIYGTDNSVEDISAQADIQNDLQNSRERQDEVVTIKNISKAQRETEGLSISSN